ncbi:ribosomal-processing cysteine protease Prp [Mycoplasma mycoides]|uniref:ribosomal-processing cysteine protease Prp n=1 Tax=Mycoplasma mycoides TaxID=2102 RepID=UPI00223FEDBE|nr:ribosomal-processing cysteine protease Prp [Mycoplasma mycoides]QVJ95155.1 ribosomal-processing cysteine protease Prp [Mycoplasma mycoides subsp. capri]
MVDIIINYKNNKIIQFEMRGHANSDEYGKDLVCAGLTAIVSGALNAIDSYYKNDVDIEVLKNKITIIVKQENNNNLQLMLDMLKIQIQTITIQYSKNARIKEVS